MSWPSIALSAVIIIVAFSVIAGREYANFLRSIRKVESRALDIEPDRTDLDQYGCILCHKRGAASGLSLITSNHRDKRAAIVARALLRCHSPQSNLRYERMRTRDHCFPRE